MTYPLSTLNDVLQHKSCTEIPRNVLPIETKAGSIQDKLITKAARTVRDIYTNSQRRVPYSARNPEAYFDACFETVTVALEAEQAVADPTTASICSAIFSRAGWFSSAIRPTTLEGQVEMQLAAIDAAERSRNLFAKQAALV